MALKHTFVSPIADQGNPNELGPDEWNADHLLAGPSPVTNISTGTAGQIARDSIGNLYLCYATNMWVRFSGDTVFGGASSRVLLRDGVSSILKRDGVSALLRGH